MIESLLDREKNITGWQRFTWQSRMATMNLQRSRQKTEVNVGFCPGFGAGRRADQPKGRWNILSSQVWKGMIDVVSNDHIQWTTPSRDQQTNKPAKNTNYEVIQNRRSFSDWLASKEVDLAERLIKGPLLPRRIPPCLGCLPLQRDGLQSPCWWKL